MADSFPKYFNPEELGKSLKEVAVDVIKTNSKDVISRWFHSAKDADLFIWLDDNKNILKQQLSYYGQVVEWNVVEGVKTGHIVEEEDNDRQAPSSEILNFDQTPQSTNIEQALRLLECITALGEDERRLLSANFRKLGSSQNMPPEEFIARFGSYLQRPHASGGNSSWWKRLVAHVSRWFKP